jgi:hypothetical protein
MDDAKSWAGEGRLAFGDALEMRVSMSLHRNGGPAQWSGEVVIHGVVAILPGDRVELVVGRSPCRALVREASVRGGAGHRTTTLRVEGESPLPPPLR